MHRVRAYLIASCLGLVASAAATGCQSPSSPLGRGEDEIIVDGAHHAGDQRVLFLPPMVANPTLHGVFDPAAEPVVRVDEIDPASGASRALIARFTTTGGSGGELVRVDGGEFHVNWHTRDFNLDPARTYRISVRIRDEVVAWADVDVVATGRELRNVDTDEYIALLDDRTLPIKFHVAADGDVDRVATFMDNCPDVGNGDQADADGDLVGDACEARIADHRLSREALIGGDAASLALEVAARGAEAIALSIDWGDGTSALQAGLAGGDRVELEHAYGAAGTFQVAATACAATGGCNTSALGVVTVLADKADAPPVAFGTGLPADEARVATAIAAPALEELALRHGLDGLDLRPAGAAIDDDDQAHVRVQQVAGGLDVFGGEGIVHLDRDGSLLTLTDALAPVGAVDTTPSLTALQAIAIARAQVACVDCLTTPPTAELMILPRDGATYLVYSVVIDRQDGTANTSMQRTFVDAHTGAIRWSYDNLQSASVTVSGTSTYSGNASLTGFQNGSGFYLEDVGRKVGTFTSNNGTTSVFRTLDTDGVFDAANQRAMVDAQYCTTKAYDYFKDVHGRDGIDGNGGPGVYTSVDGVTRLISSVVHYSSNYNNAFWNGSYLTFGDGDGSTFSSLTTVDICGHELAHGITERTAGLIYAGESGALNESMSDVFGAMVDRYTNGESAATYRIGEGCYTPANGTGDALRYMDSPHLAGNGGFTTDDDPDHYSERYTGTGDNGGVHINSGIGNKAFHLVAKGGSHHLGGSMTGIGPDAAAAIWWKALTSYMTSSTGYAGARTATLNAAAALYGAGSTNHKAVCDAWAMVGVGSSCSAPPPPPPPPGNELLGNGGFETALAPWVSSGTGALYTNNGNFPQAGTGYVYFGGANSVAGQTYQTITIPAGTAPTLSFYLNVTSAETTTSTKYDQLFVEVRSSAGTLLGTLATYSNLDKVATSGAYSVKSASLAGYAGKTVRVQFRTTTDSSAITTFRIDTVSAKAGGAPAAAFGEIEPPASGCGGVDQPACPLCEDPTVCGAPPVETDFAWEASDDHGATWRPVTLPDTDFGCTSCTRLYRTYVTGRPSAVSFRFASDNEGRMLVNGAIGFDDYYLEGVDWCTADACCSQCCDTYENCTNIVAAQAPFTLSAAALSEFGPAVNEIIWQVNQQYGGSGFHTVMSVTR